MTLGVTDLNINDTDRSGNMTPYLALTTHRSMVRRLFLVSDYRYRLPFHAHTSLRLQDQC